MEGIITNYRRSVHEQKCNQMIIQIEEITSADKARKLVGKTVVWTSPAGKEIKGEVRAPHGTKGCIRALFETGMPGQSMSTKVKIE